MVSARNLIGLQSLVSEIRAIGGTAELYPADVTQPEQMDALAAETARIFGHIDTWVHVAGVGVWAYFEDTTPEEFKRVIDVNLMGQVHGAMAALPYIKRQGGGAMIHVSSAMGKVALPLQSAYAASKHGMAGFLDVLRLELQEKRIPISVTNIMPSAIDTPLFKKALTKMDVEPKALAPVYPPDIVADAILYAAEHPTRDIVAGAAGRFIVSLRAIAPALVDSFIQWISINGQRSNRPKSALAPNNLYGSLDGFNHVTGSQTPGKPNKAYTWLRSHPLALAVPMLLLSALLVGKRSFRS
jgi:NAD(P)-dependent dehydrogenase (short-subunit alcohol dehydrogenase family)